MSSVLSKVFGGKPQAPKPYTPVREISQSSAQSERDRILKQFSKMRRATMTSELSQANVRRRTLGAGI